MELVPTDQMASTIHQLAQLMREAIQTAVGVVRLHGTAEEPQALDDLPQEIADVIKVSYAWFHPARPELSESPELTPTGEHALRLLRGAPEAFRAAGLRDGRHAPKIASLAAYAGPPLAALAVELVQRHQLLFLAPQVLVRDPTQAETLAPLIAQAIDERTLSLPANPLLEYPWSGQLDYACALLGHELTTQREAAVGYFVRRGVEHQDLLVSMLGDASVNVRLSAMRALARMGYADRDALLYYLKHEREQVGRFRLAEMAGFGPELSEAIARPGGADALAATCGAEVRLRASTFDWLKLSTAPALRWSDGTLASEAALVGLLKMQRYAERGLLSKRVRQLICLLDRPTTPQFARALLERWVEAGAPIETIWIVPLAYELGDATLLPIVRSMVKLCHGDQRYMALNVVLQALVLLDLPEVRAYLVELGYGNRYGALPDNAISTLQQIATQHGCTLMALIDQHAPTCGLDAQGGMWLDYGPRSFRALLGADFKLQIEDARGKRRASLPAPGVADDQQRVAAAKVALKELRTALRRALKQQQIRMERALELGHRWDVQAWRAGVLGHPVLRHVAERLIWAQRGPDGVYRTFRPDAEGQLIASDGSLLDVDPRCPVELARTFGLSTAERDAWTKYLRSRMITPFIAQGFEDDAQTPQP